MPIPDSQAIMLPLLEHIKDEKDHSFTEVIDFLADEFNLTEEEKSILVGSGKRPLFNNRVYEAKRYLEKAGLLISPYSSKNFLITQEGLKILAQKPKCINTQFLKRYKANHQCLNYTYNKQEDYVSKKVDDKVIKQSLHSEDSKIVLENAYQKLQETLAIEILETIKTRSSQFFESLVVNLLVSMGYGGSIKEAGQAVGKSGDGGIDGFIKEDKLGLEIIYIQAKRFDNAAVGRPEIQKFAGALDGQRSRKGVFITTSSFTNEALNYVKSIEKKIILIDGIRLTELMIEHNVGVTPIARYEVKRIDSDYFIEN